MAKLKMYKVGSKVVHPAHGAGVISSVEQKDVLDDFNRYYVIDLAAQDMTLMVPVRMAEEIGLRRVATKKSAKQIMEILGSEAKTLPDDFKKRQALVHDRLREGSTEALAEVVRDMASRGHSKTYSPTEARVFEQARGMLGGEMALALGIEVATALSRIDAQVAEPESDD
ncbi:MAG: CarD family transcriptional regulator [Anaerolineae bacterium]